jgi:hypothetical protein
MKFTIVDETFGEKEERSWYSGSNSILVSAWVRPGRYRITPRSWPETIDQVDVLIEALKQASAWVLGKVR